VRRARLVIEGLLALGVGLTLAGGGCSGNETGPVSGELVVRLAAPGNDVRAVLLRLGGTATGIRVAPGRPYVVFTSSPAPDTAVIAVVAPSGQALAAGDLLRVAVPDTRKARSYTATLTQVAGTDFQLRVVGAYALEVRKP
jgi:hypothetical protein